MVNELVLAVNHALHGCLPTPTPIGGAQGGGGFTVTVDVGTASGMPGASLNVPISISGGWGFVAAVQVDLLYDITAIDPYFDCVLSSRLQDGQSVVARLVPVPPAPVGMRRLRVSVFPSFSSIAGFTDGEVAVCTFDLSDTATAGNVCTTSTGTGDERRRRQPVHHGCRSRFDYRLRRLRLPVKRNDESPLICTRRSLVACKPTRCVWF